MLASLDKPDPRELIHDSADPRSAEHDPIAEVAHRQRRVLGAVQFEEDLVPAEGQADPVPQLALHVRNELCMPTEQGPPRVGGELTLVALGHDANATRWLLR